MPVDRIDMNEAEWLHTLYLDMEQFDLSPWGKVRLLGLLINLICKHEGRHVLAKKLSNMFDKIQATQIDHEIDREIDDGLTMDNIAALAETRREFPDHTEFHKGPQFQ